MILQKITPFLWFSKNNGLEAATFYTSVFKNSRIVSTNPFVTVVELEGLSVALLNGGPVYELTEAFSLSISCETQEEIDYYWYALSKDGTESRCGWLKDKFGLSWQVVPSILPSLMNDPESARRVTAAFMKMKKFEIEKLLNA